MISLFDFYERRAFLINDYNVFDTSMNKGTVVRIISTSIEIYLGICASSLADKDIAISTKNNRSPHRVGLYLDSKFGEDRCKIATCREFKSFVTHYHTGTVIS